VTIEGLTFKLSTPTGNSFFLAQYLAYKFIPYVGRMGHQ